MRTELKWKKGAFSNMYEIKGKAFSGRLQMKSMSFNAVGEVNGNRYSFNAYGFFRKRIEIFDMKTKKMIAKVHFSSWKSRATITTKEKNYSWRHMSIWGKNWRISDDSHTYMQSYDNGWGTKGEIISADVDGFLILSGLYIKNYFIRMHASAGY